MALQCLPRRRYSVSDSGDSVSDIVRYSVRDNVRYIVRASLRVSVSELWLRSAAWRCSIRHGGVIAVVIA